MNAFGKFAWKSLLLPNGVLLIAVALVLHAGWLAPVLPAVGFLNYAAVIVGLLLAWRFHSSRAFFAVFVLFLAEQALTTFSGGHTPIAGSGRIAFDAVSVLLPLNFVLISLIPESALTLSLAIPMAVIWLVQAASIALACRNEPPTPAHTFHHAVPSLPLSDYAWLAFASTALVLVLQFLRLRKPLENGLLWSMAAFFLGLHFGGVSRYATTYYAASAIMLSVSLVETSYLLAYRDELTSLPSRRAFKDAVANLQVPYSIAMVDIDHFKRFNDTFGHDTGDQVLQLVASRLAGVSGGGKAFRCGGEEFAILFEGKTTLGVFDNLEELRSRVASSPFRVRSLADRRRASRGPDRRTRGRQKTGHAIRRLTKVPPIDVENPGAVSITVSIGVASANEVSVEAEAVIQAADKALYRAKAAGRNRVEVASSPRRQGRSRAAGIA